MSDGPWSRHRVLIVDDAKPNLMLLAEALKGDYRVSFAANGADALRLAAAEPQPDLILLDVVMPGMDGYDVCRHLKERPETASIPVIFLTGKSEVEDETRGLSLGAVDYVTKPFSLAIVQARVRTHLELKRHRDLLEKLSALDGLTGIPNRRRLDEAVALEWRRAARDREAVGLLMIDVDHFKKFNDTYGHGAGDDCLRQVATAISGAVRRAGDLVARYGGEEFAVILPATDSAGCRVVADTILAAVAALDIPHATSGVGDSVTVSVGGASRVPQPGDPCSALFELADGCLYESKKSGRNRVTIAPEAEKPDHDRAPGPATAGRD